MKRLLLIAFFTLLATCSSPSNTEIGKDVPDAPETTQDGGAVDLEAVTVPCGDGICTKDLENCDICPADCGVCECGDGECTAPVEDCSNCAEDCGDCEPNCGDDECGVDEDCESCPGDCGNCCPNGVCGDDETCDSCPEDCDICPDPCGDDECADDEDCESCPADCECECGDETCNGEETCESCPEDCACECGDEVCGDDEDCENCPDDCGECVCGDEACNGEETCDTCPEDCTNCDPMCGDNVVDAELDEECDDGNTAPDDGCDEECKLEPQSAEPGDIVITEIMKNPEMVDDVVGEWFELYNSSDDAIDLNGWLLADEGIDQHKIFSYEGVVIQSKSYLVFGKEADKELNGGLDVDYVYSNFNLSNKDDEIILSVYGVAIDEVAYDNGQNFPGEPGKSMSLSPASYDGAANDDGASWCDGSTAYGDGDLGSPGESNPDCDGQECGNDVCEDAESCTSCPDDCGPCCPNEVCGDDEDCASCPQDCGSCCPNDACDFGESCETCEADCGPCPVDCPNDECGDDETCDTCPQDCGECDPKCGDAECNGDETCLSCPGDCGSCCGNDACDNGETCVTCPGDCGSCCGNNACDNGETCSTCPGDCGSCCGNDACDNGETCTTCPGDCGACPEESWCKLSGSQGEKIECTIKLATISNSSPKATQFQFDMNFDSSKVAFDSTTCEKNGVDLCTLVGVLPTQHAIGTAVQGPGVVRLTLTKSGEAVAISQAYMQGNNVLGNPYVLDLVFSLKTNVSANSAVQVTLTDMLGSDATGSKLSATQKDAGLLVTEKGGAGPECGDNECNGDETCSDCPGDCGACPESGWCQLSGSSGASVNCAINIAAESSGSAKATQFQFDMNFDSAKVEFDSTTCKKNGVDLCDLVGVLPTQHAVQSAVQSAGVVRLTLTKSGEAVAISQAYLQGGNVQGDAWVLDLVFKLKSTISAGSPEAVSLTGMLGSEATGSKLTATQQADGLIVTKE
jgi:hypothetical protein